MATLTAAVIPSLLTIPTDLEVAVRILHKLDARDVLVCSSVRHPDFLADVMIREPSSDSRPFSGVQTSSTDRHG